MTDAIDFQAGNAYDVFEAFEKSGGDLGVPSPFDGKAMMQYATMKTKPEYMNYMGSINDTLVDLQSDFKEAVSALNAKIADCKDPAIKQQLKGSLDEMKNAWTMITQQPPEMNMKIGAFRGKWQERISDMRQAITTASVATQSVDTLNIGSAPQTKIGKPVHLNHASGTSGASSASAASSGKTDADGKMDLSDFDVENMVNLMSSDPQAAMAELNNLSKEDRSLALQMVNTKLQDMNQMFSMMSNIMKSLHDTAKAAINNMRV